MRLLKLIPLLGCIPLLSGCASSYNPCKALDYISIRPTIVIDETTNPIDDASIAVYSVYGSNGDFNVVVQNLTDDILTIDQTKSFVIMPDKQSKPYYDPTIRSHTTSSSVSSGNGISLNLGGIANVVGINGVGKSILSSLNVGGAQSSTSASTYTEILADQPQVSIGPRGKMAMSKTFNIGYPNSTFIAKTPQESPFTFSVIISYSFDNGKTYDKITSDFYCNAYLWEAVYKGRTNDAMRKLITLKPNMTLEPWYLIRSSRASWRGNFPTFINYQ